MKFIFIFIYFLYGVMAANCQSVLVEAELFKNKGGWSADTQFIDQMGSPYLLAHGLGEVVEDAVTEVQFPEIGLYHVWMRTKDWAPYPKGPGQFRLDAAMTRKGPATIQPSIALGTYECNVQLE